MSAGFLAVDWGEGVAAPPCPPLRLRNAPPMLNLSALSVAPSPPFSAPPLRLAFSFSGGLGRSFLPATIGLLLLSGLPLVSDVLPGLSSAFLPITCQ
eukprot:1192966-Prorocentrum_minimum.AAC.4